MSEIKNLKPECIWRNFDVWNNSMDLAGVPNGGVVGFKYFGFGGLAKHTKGIKPFEGTKKGDGGHPYVEDHRESFGRRCRRG